MSLALGCTLEMSPFMGLSVEEEAGNGWASNASPSVAGMSSRIGSSLCDATDCNVSVGLDLTHEMSSFMGTSVEEEPARGWASDASPSVAGMSSRSP